jgi:alcohol dehydrogenase (cytochrome c)
MSKRLATLAWAGLAMTGVATAQPPPPAQDELSEQQRLRQFSPGGPLTPGVELPRWPTAANPLDATEPVTDELLANPSPSDWLTWRRTHDGLGFSPLTGIDKGNVDELQLAWSLALPAGPNAATPLVHDGVIYVHSYGDHVQALDAATGDELWHYARELPNDFRPTVKRNLALYGDKIYFGTSDVHVVALNVRTGDVVWDQPITEPNSGFGLSGGPLVAAGNVMQGVNGQAPGGAYIVGLDAETGKEAWRFYSIARPGEPGGDTWNGLPVEQRTGGSVWTAGSYDAERKLAFFGPAPTYDTGPLRDPVDRRGVTNEALYTNSTVALHPDTGKVAWYFQHVPNDQWDFDWAFERQLIDLPVNGRQRKVLVTSGKEAIYDALDVEDGRYLFSIDLGLQNIITKIDPRTGAKEIDPSLIPSREKPVIVCPHAGGAKSWVPASINPQTKMLYVPMVETCMDLTPVPQDQRGSLSTGVRWTIRPRLDSDGRFGRIQAIDLDTRETVWSARQRAPQTTGVLATAGGLVFAGALDRWFTAYDDATGEALWRARLSDVPSAAPISYAVNGKQYVAMVVGYGSAHAITFPMLTPEIDLPIVRSSTIWVFAHPED